MNIARLRKRVFGLATSFIQVNGTVTFITGANAPFYNSLKNNLLISLHRWEPQAKIIVWDLGLLDAQLLDLQNIAKDFGNIIIRRYPVNSLPKHYDMERWNYAFKSYCIFTSINEINTDFAFWLDAGCGIVSRMNAERVILKRYGYYSPYSSTTVGQLTHEGIMDSFGDDVLNIAPKQMLSGGVQGYNLHSRFAHSLLSIWYNLITNEHTLAPVGSDLTNHRFDQSILSLVYYCLREKVPYLARYYYNIRIHLNKS